MITKECRDAYTEIDEILSFLPSEYVLKIPLKLREFFHKAADDNYVSKIDPYKRLDEQELLPKTKTILTILYRDYWCTEEERAELDEILIDNDRKYRLEYYKSLVEQEEKLEGEKDES